MNRQEQIFAALERMGYKPQYDDEGDIILIYQMKTLYFYVEQDESFASVIYTQFHDIEEDEMTLYLAACNKLNRIGRLAKLYVDQSEQHISAACDFFYDSDEMLEFCIANALRIIGVTRTAFRKCVRELLEP